MLIKSDWRKDATFHFGLLLWYDEGFVVTFNQRMLLFFLDGNGVVFCLRIAPFLMVVDEGK